MNGGKPAPLAPTLLFAKGRAHPVGYEGELAKPGPAVIVDPVSRALPQTPAPQTPAPKTAGTRRGSNPTGDVKLSFHVDATRHRRLKLAMAHLRRTGQEFVIAAVDHYLDHVVPGLLEQSCPCLAVGGAMDAPPLRDGSPRQCFCASDAAKGPPG
jgi:hypothetical protein